MNSLHLPNMKLAIFDFDGTIADTSEGIIDSHKFTFSKIGKSFISDEEIRTFIGGNLLRIYTNILGDEEQAKIAVQIYRKRYSEVGIHKAVLYPNFIELLSLLKIHNIKTGVATLKAECFAKTMLKEMHIDGLFNTICGMDNDDFLNKASIISNCLDYCGIKAKDAVLIGDTESDLKGAIETGVNFIGVTYGFGFKSSTNEGNFIKAGNPLQIAELLIY